MNRVRWLDRRVAAPGPYLALCLNEQQFAAACRHIRCDSPSAWIKNEWSNATAHYFDTAKGLTVVVCVRGWEGRHPVEVAGLLVHEAVHVWQQYAERIGETHPGHEQEAYAIQAISQELMDEFAQQMQAMHDSQRSEKD